MSEPAGESSGTSEPARLRTVSLRRRVVLYSLAVLGVVLVLVSVLAEVFVGIGSRSDLEARLAERAALADQLSAQGVGAAELVERLNSPSVRVRLVGPDGQVRGSRYPVDEPDRRDRGRMSPSGPERMSPPDPDRMPGPRFGRPGSPSGPVLRRTLPDGSQLTLVADADELSVVQRRLARLLALLGVAGLGVAGVALLATTRVALGPLDAMTALARSIAGGDRGRRLAPTRTDTELGRTAAAFDDMLDALEGAERQARHAEAQARESESRTRQFVADAAHELRTPIAGLRAVAEASLSSRLDGEDRDRMQLLLIREAARAGALVEDLLAMARIDAGLALQHEPVELRALAESEVERTRLLAPTLLVTVAGEPITVSADPGRLAQVLANLLDNARRHTPDGGEVTVTIDRAAGGTARIRVADTGPGVPEVDRERIFDRLVRLDQARAREGSQPGRGAGGAGLGLAIARGIARAHGGELRCTGDSVFELTLPLGPPPRPPTEPSTRAGPQPARTT
ncbi:MAG: sensor histidine kinase [Pseudonocardia sp.]